MRRRFVFQMILEFPSRCFMLNASAREGVGWKGESSREDMFVVNASGRRQIGAKIFYAFQQQQNAEKTTNRMPSGDE